MHFTPAQITLLQLLGDGDCHSGSELGATLGITRSAIWKQIHHLIASGIPIKRIRHQGYQLPNQLILLNKQQIMEHLASQKQSSPFNLHLFTSIDSTNRYLKDLPPSNTVDICCAEIQTQGRGRFGRHWHSPFGENLYCSTRWNINYDLTKLSGLSLVTSLAVLATLNEFDISSNIKIKWPNDILWAHKKLCGSLIEILAESNGNVQIIIGIGLNVNTDTENNPLPDKPWCSLYEITKQRFDRNILIARLIINLELYLSKFIHHDLNFFMDEWNKSDYLFGKNIKVTQSINALTGIACGINQIGQLILQDEAGTKHFLSSGDTSLHERP
ncbi:biotin--[acetyl-CoA-carboxylase] ligase [Legionella parisiensis]|uniref:Bifunctional ligase/repressor BirA n=1 Tax=Legionella parisiensis TaxID=45071 RepID=A0A1E5JTT4_9GAMM|nr:biotin--[acetyl-CoA-carboxylase] ligase [Legionella parisiensis]KTD44729.1 biotin-[acetylCoA carboxylase] holoenzyme synthetase and biotin operon repressor [Legionella parisiensis]OEH47478.1 Bifunctional ligase/repressor BirA [Legionella parisiensis]STX76913.1 biotin-[acetylCoA carboxylase] holoenzyme synthetase and biotin operon repressor [Legionella parisiensis]